MAPTDAKPEVNSSVYAFSKISKSVLVKMTCGIC